MNIATFYRDQNHMMIIFCIAIIFNDNFGEIFSRKSQYKHKARCDAGSVETAKADILPVSV